MVKGIIVIYQYLSFRALYRRFKKIPKAAGRGNFFESEIKSREVRGADTLLCRKLVRKTQFFVVNDGYNPPTQSKMPINGPTKDAMKSTLRKTKHYATFTIAYL